MYIIKKEWNTSVMKFNGSQFSFDHWFSLISEHQESPMLRTYCVARNIGVELNLAVGEINCVSPNFIPPTFNTCLKHYKHRQY